MIYLYVKKCSHCDKKYFGKTYAKDPYSYSGSGVHWKRHLKAHDAFHQTIQIWKFLSQAEATHFAEKFSSYNNIVESSEWFNLIPENALDGNPKGNVPWNKGRETSLKNMTYEEIYGKDKAIELKAMRSKSNKKRGSREQNTKDKISVTRKKRIGEGTIKIVPPPIRPQNLNKAMRKVKCDHCDIIASYSNIKRWHNNKCKSK